MTHHDGTAMLADEKARSDSRVMCLTDGPVHGAEERAGAATPPVDAGLSDGFLSTEELASLIGVDPSTLRRWRTATPPEGPPFTPLSSRVTVYSIVDVRQWIAGRRIDPGQRA